MNGLMAAILQGSMTTESSSLLPSIPLLLTIVSVLLLAMEFPVMRGFA